jgi:drug/metabolite transporter (DMT)-like permease
MKRNLEPLGYVRDVRGAYLMLGATITIWALNFTVTRYVLEHGFHPIAYSVVRYGIAAVLFAILTYALEGSLRVRREDLPLLAVAALFGIFLNQVSYVYAIHLTNASTTALILGSTPIFAALVALAFGWERMRRLFWTAAAVSFAGVALVAAGGGEVRGDIWGDLLGVATAATRAAYSVAIAPLMRRYSPFRISAVVLAFGWIPLALTGSHQVATQDFHLGWQVWALLGYAVLAPLFLTNILWFKSVDRVGPSHATLVANFQPFLAVAFAVPILNESLSWLQVLGGAGIAAGIVLAHQAHVASGGEGGLVLASQRLRRREQRLRAEVGERDGREVGGALVAQIPRAPVGEELAVEREESLELEEPVEPAQAEAQDAEKR